MQFNRFQTLADIFILIGLVIFGGIIFGTLGKLICSLVYDLDMNTVERALKDSGNHANVGLIKIANLFVNFGVWVASALIFIKIRHYNVSMTWQLKLPKPFRLIWVLPIICLALLFISSFLMNVSSAIPFPESIKNLSSSANHKLLENMLLMENVKQLFINILVIGLAPALFEEIFFRGTLQRLLIHLFGNAHAGVFITSFIFAAIHLNVMQFIPMLFLAMVFGYICFYTKSIWPGIILHFLNNSAAVIVNYYENRYAFAQQIADDNYNPPIILTVLSFGLIAWVFYWLVTNYRKEEELIHE